MRPRLPVLVAFALAVSAPAAAAPLPPLESMAAVDGQVHHVLATGEGVLLAGSFGDVGRFAGGSLLLDPGSGAADGSFAPLRGHISDAVPDGAGGWYVAGDIPAGRPGVERNVVHLLPSGERDPAFRAPTRIEFGSALALTPEALYVADYWSGVLRLDPKTGRRVAAFRAPGASFTTELELAGGRLYVADDAGVQSVDLDTGISDPSFRCLACLEAGLITALENDGTRLFVGDSDTGVFAVDLKTGARDARFAPPSRPASGTDTGPLVLALDGGRLLVGGRGLELGGPSPTLVALDPATGAAQPGFAAGFADPVHDLILQGDELITGGAPVDEGSPALSTLDRATGVLRSRAQTELDGAIDALAPGPAARVYAGGRFQLWAPAETNGVALLDSETGLPRPGFAVPADVAAWVRDPPVVVRDRIVLRTTTAIRQGRAWLHLRQFDLRTGAEVERFREPAIVFNPESADEYFGAVVKAQGSRLYVGHVIGDRETTWPQARIRVLDALTGEEKRRYDLPLPGYLTDIVPRGKVLYVTGSFRRVSPDGRPQHLAAMAIDARSGRLRPRFDPHVNGPVYAAGSLGGRLFLTGLFDSAWGRPRHGLTAVFTGTGFLDRDFRPELSRDRSLAVTMGAPLPLPAGVLAVPGPPGDIWSLSTYRPTYWRVTTGARLAAPGVAGESLDRVIGVGGRDYVVVASRHAIGSRTFVGYLPDPRFRPAQ